MGYWKNGVYYETPEPTAEELAQIKEAEEAQLEYWSTIPYKEAVNAEIRKRYDESDEFAILRQKDEKPEEYQEYYEYCEQCKQYVKEKKNLTQM